MNENIRKNYLNIPYFDINIIEEKYIDGVNKIISLIRKNWNLESIKYKVFKDGYTNKLIACMETSDEDLMYDVILFRVYGNGSSLIINRDQEFFTMAALSQIGCSSIPYARFNNGLAYGFHKGEVLDNNSVILPDIQKLVIKEMVRMHSVDVNALINSIGFDQILPCFTKVPDLFPTLRKWLSRIPNTFFEELINTSCLKELNITRNALDLEINLLEKELVKLNSPVVFCHNDLLLKNIIYNDEKKKISFIDFEYASYNYQAFDIGNHFCEYAGMEQPDFTLYPSRDYQLKWLKLFLIECNNNNIDDVILQNGINDITDDQVQCLYIQVNKFALAAHLYWALWAIIQSMHSSITYDYLSFAKSKLTEYRNKKEEFLTL